MVHMECQVLFSLKNNKINFRMSSAANLLSALRVNYCQNNGNSCPLDHKQIKIQSHTKIKLNLGLNKYASQRTLTPNFVGSRIRF